MNRSSLRVSLSAALLLLGSVATSAEAPATESPSPREAVVAADQAYNRSARERDRAGFRELLAQDVVFLAGELQRGRLAMLNVWQPLFDGKYDFRLDSEHLDVVVAESGDLAYTVGTARTSFTRPGLSEAQSTDSHYLNVWTPGEEGRWQLVVSSSLVAHPTLGSARDSRSGLMTAWPELEDQIGSEIELKWSPEKTVRAASGELAYTFGAYDASFKPADGDKAPGSAAGETVEAQHGAGHFVTVWQKNDRGAWQPVAEGFTPPGIYHANDD